MSNAESWTSEKWKRFLFDCALIETGPEGGGFRLRTGTPFTGYYEITIPTENEFRYTVYNLIYEWGGDPQIASLAFEKHGMSVCFQARVDTSIYKAFMREHADARSRVEL